MGARGLNVQYLWLNVQKRRLGSSTGYCRKSVMRDIHCAKYLSLEFTRVKKKCSNSHRAHILSCNASGLFASVFGFLWYFFFFFLLQGFPFLFFRHFLAFLSRLSSSLLSLERPMIDIPSTLPCFISSRTSIFTTKWQVSFLEDGTLWRTSI